MSSATGASPLSGVKVVDFTRQMAGPYGTLVLGDFGADVVKVESLPDGDPSRRTGTAFVDGEAGVFLQWNRSKRSVAVDLRESKGLEVVLRLIDGADVVVENYRPGVAEEIGIGYEAVAERNPRLIYCSLSAFGRAGPYAGVPGTDPVLQAMSGIMSVTGEPGGGPLLTGVPVADFAGAMMVVQGVLLGLLARQRTGQGQRVDISMLGSMLFSLSTRLATYWATGADSERFGSAHSVVMPYQAYDTADGVVVAGAWSPEGWPRFCAAVERPDLQDDPRFATNPERIVHREALNAELVPRFKEKTTEEWEAAFHRERALFGEVCTISRALTHPQTQALGLVRSMEHSRLGTIPQLAGPIEMSTTPSQLRLPPPVLGEHTSEVLAEVGYSDDDIARLVDAGIVLTTEGSTRRGRTTHRLQDRGATVEAEHKAGPDYQFITSEPVDDGTIVRIMLARPDARNAQNRGLLVELDDALSHAEADDRVRVIILGGEGEIFSSGHDLGSSVDRAERAPGPEQHPTMTTHGGSRVGPERRMLQDQHFFFGNTLRWRNLRKITIAEVHGPVFAAGLMLMWACDLIVAAEGTTFADVVGTRLGMCGVEYFAHPWEFGPRKTKELMLTGDALDADEAYRLGMVSKVFARDQLAEGTLGFARRIAQLPTMAALLIKESVNQTVDNMGFTNSLHSCFTLHQLNHAHWTTLNGSDIPVAQPEHGVPHWRDAQPVRVAAKNSV